MVIEHVYLSIKPQQSEAFEHAFQQAQQIIAPMQGLNTIQLMKNSHDPHRYILMISWERIEDHTEGFRQSEAYLQWKALLHDFYDPFPTVEYYQPCLLRQKK